MFNSRRRTLCCSAYRGSTGIQYGGLTPQARPQKRKAMISPLGTFSCVSTILWVVPANSPKAPLGAHCRRNPELCFSRTAVHKMCHKFSPRWNSIAFRMALTTFVLDWWPELRQWMARKASACVRGVTNPWMTEDGIITPRITHAMPVFKIPIRITDKVLFMWINYGKRLIP